MIVFGLREFLGFCIIDGINPRNIGMVIFIGRCTMKNHYKKKYLYYS